MSKLTFSANEVALLEVTLQHINHFMHATDRTPQELEAFRAKIYPLVHELYYGVLGERFSDADRVKISGADIDDQPVRQQVEWFTRLITDWSDDINPR